MNVAAINDDHLKENIVCFRSWFPNNKFLIILSFLLFFPMFPMPITEFFSFFY